MSFDVFTLWICDRVYSLLLLHQMSAKYLLNGFEFQPFLCFLKSSTVVFLNVLSVCEDFLLLLTRVPYSFQFLIMDLAELLRMFWALKPFWIHALTSTWMSAVSLERLKTYSITCFTLYFRSIYFKLKLNINLTLNNILLKVLFLSKRSIYIDLYWSISVIKLWINTFYRCCIWWIRFIRIWSDFVLLQNTFNYLKDFLFVHHLFPFSYFKTRVGVHNPF